MMQKVFATALLSMACSGFSHAGPLASSSSSSAPPPPKTVVASAESGLLSARRRTRGRLPTRALATRALATTGGSERQVGGRVSRFVDANFLLVGMAFTVAVAGLFPGIGCDGSFLRPEKLIGTLGVPAVFFISGLGLQLGELKEAALDFKFNLAVQATSLGVIPALSWVAIRCCLEPLLKGVHPALWDGLLATACLPTTINMCVLLTQQCEGNVALSLANAVFGNVLGVFVSPALLLLFLKKGGSVKLGPIIGKLALKVLLPVGLGQLARLRILPFYQRNKKGFKRTSELVLLSIVWNAFSNSFKLSHSIRAAELAMLGLLLPALHFATLTSLEAFYSRFYEPKEATAAALIASQKTLGFGLPLLKTVFAKSPDLAYLCAPIMILHPAQLLIGSALVPRFKKKNAHQQLQNTEKEK